jgi:hypothetical protein
MKTKQLVEPRVSGNDLLQNPTSSLEIINAKISTRNCQRERSSPAPLEIINASASISLGKSRDNSSQKQSFPIPYRYHVPFLIALAMKNSASGSIVVGEICKFILENFLNFKADDNQWKNEVYHILATDKCFVNLVDVIKGSFLRRNIGGLWCINPTQLNDVEKGLLTWCKSYRQEILKNMSDPKKLEAIEKGNPYETYVKF